MKNTFINITIVISTLLFFLIILEMCVRLFGIWYISDFEAVNWYRPSNISGVPYLLKPNLDEKWGQGRVMTNSEGLRANHSFPEQHPDKLRILALGDSITFGFGVDQADTFPAKLEALLNNEVSQNRQVEVINAGINGLSLADEANYLPMLIDRYDPDVIIWTLVPNDYDDSLGITEKGTSSWASSDYVLTSSYEFTLGQDNNKPTDFNDFRKSMTPTALNWATGAPLKPSSVEELLKKSYAYNWLVWMIKDIMNHNSSHDHSSNPIPKTAHTRQESWKSADGREYPFPAHIALYSYQSRIKTFNKKIADIRKLTTSKHIPLLIVNTNLPIKSRNMVDEPFYFYNDSSALINQPFIQFHQRYNLRWDAHFSPEGNQIFALGLIKGLVCNKIIEGPANCEELKKNQIAYHDYWKSFAVSQDAYTSQFRSFIDFQNYSNFPQIAGGVFPPREFPGGPSQRAEFLLARPTTNPVFHLRMSNIPSAGLKLRLTFTLGAKTLQREGIISSSNLLLDFDLSELFRDDSLSKLIEVSLTCPDHNCSPAKLVYIGFGNTEHLSQQ